MIKETCVETYEEALLAQERGANRIELCSDLENDGLTPTLEFVEAVHSTLSIPVRVMIRPHADNFIYSREHLDGMVQAINQCKEIGVDGVVFGVLDQQGEMDVERIRFLVAAADPLNVTIHKAIDVTEDPVEALRLMLDIDGISSVLTSGGAPSAEEGLAVLERMIEMTSDKIELIVAGKVTDKNIGLLHKKLNSPAYHGRKIVGDLRIA